MIVRSFLNQTFTELNKSYNNFIYLLNISNNMIMNYIIYYVHVQYKTLKLRVVMNTDSIKKLIYNS